MHLNVLEAILWDLAGDDDPEDLKEGDADADPADQVRVALGERLDLGVAPVRTLRSKDLRGLSLLAFAEVVITFGIHIA